MNHKKAFYERIVKRPQDFLFSLLGLIILSPVFLIVAILIRIKLGSPVIFTQLRPGLNEKIFRMYKFRTMTDARNEKGELLPDSVRLTKFGRLLRATSLDELPELFNILKGDMSIVGPRPQLVKDMVFMTSDQRKRHTVYPGLTGLAQVRGRNCISWEDKIMYDLKYIRKITFLNDWWIMLDTIFKVFKKENISTEGMDTAEDLGDYLLRIGKMEKEEYQKRLELSKELTDEHRNAKKIFLKKENI